MTFEEFETAAAEFYEETGWLAPGKDWPAAMLPAPDEKELRERWNTWLQERDWKLARAAVGDPPFEPAAVIEWLEQAGDVAEQEFVARRPHPSEGSGEVACRMQDAEWTLRQLFGLWP